MKVKTAELIGSALDWAVATASGAEIRINPGHGLFANHGEGFEYYMPSEEWGQGGPIIEREEISVGTDTERGDRKWNAVRYEKPAYCEEVGPTPLVAAMRCYVVSQLGDEVEVPDELL